MNRLPFASGYGMAIALTLAVASAACDRSNAAAADLASPPPEVVVHTVRPKAITPTHDFDQERSRWNDQRMKAELGPDMAILGSGSVVTRLAGAGLIDTIQIVVNPVALGTGKSFLAGLRQPLNFTTHARPDVREWIRRALVCR